MLDDTLARLKIDRELQQLITHLRSDDPVVYQRIDPQDLLQLLTSYGNWPTSRSLQFLNKQGQVTWSFGDLQKPTIRIREDQLNNGDLLKTVLRALTPEEITAQFGERASDPQLSLERRTTLLRKRLAKSAEEHRAALFESRYGSRQYTREPHAQKIMDSAPGLPASIARHVLIHATGEELATLDAQKKPERLATLARTALEELRLNRAYEGQHIVTYGTLDTDRLALNSLKLQPGWSAQIRLEARHLGVDGELWNEVGPADAPTRRTLVRTHEGRYVPHDTEGPLSGETDLYSAILSALPDLHRKALRIEIHQGAELKRRLREHPLAREPLRTLLNPQSADRLPQPALETQHLLGMDGYPAQAPGVAQPLTLQDRARQLFPILDDTEIQTLINHLDTEPGGADLRLMTLTDEYRQLELDLHTWQNDLPASDPTSNIPLTARQRRYERQNRRHIAQRLRQCWRRATPMDNYYEDPARNGQVLRLEFPVRGELPHLPSAFNHVTLLAITGHESTLGAEAFIRHFPNLRHLEVRNIPLGDLPTHLSTLTNLTTLNLDSCQITLTPASQATLASLRRLRGLNLHGNPLGLTPRVDSMTGLLDLDLSATGIDRLPEGLLDLTELETVFLNDNRISELPAPLFDLPLEASQRFDLSNNPLTRPTLERIKLYFQRHGVHWEADAMMVDRQDAHRLFPALNNSQINRFIFSLPGNLEAGQMELARLAGELEALQRELHQWSTLASLPELELARRKAVAQRLENAWRTDTPQVASQFNEMTLSPPLVGELPTLETRFTHTHYLAVQGSGEPLRLEGFLDSFPNLMVLSLQNVVLGDIPAPIFRLKALTHLALPDCAITLTTASRAALEHMSGLQHLNLNQNLLVHIPDFRRMPALLEVSLERTGLLEVPAGLPNPDWPGRVNLRNNAIQTLPEHWYTLPAPMTLHFYLAGNPLSATTLEQIKLYCQRTGEHFNVPAPTPLREQALHLYPSLEEREADRFVFNLPGTMKDVRNRLDQLQAEYAQLETDLEQWALDVPERHPIIDIALDEQTRAQQQLQRRDFKILLEQAWRRESPEDEESLDEELTHSLILDTQIMGELPQLNARFTHVSRLELNGSGTTTGVDGTLRCFPQLQTLTLKQCSLGTLPKTLFALPRLTSLDLSHCAITLTADTAHSISDLSSLELLDLSHNPLVFAPDVSKLNELMSVHLRSTGISEVPRGIFRLSELQTLDLSNNAIAEIPADILDTPAVFHEDSDLSGNPLSARSLGYLRACFQRTGMDFEVPQATLDEHGNPLTAPLYRPQEE